MDIAKAVQKIEERAMHRVELMADRYRLKKLIPFCRRQGFEYIAGNGRTLFCSIYDSDVTIGSKDEAVRQGFPTMAALFDDLDVVVFDRNQVFGYFIKDVKRTDYHTA